MGTVLRVGERRGELGGEIRQRIASVVPLAQNTSLCENKQGTLVFVAGTFHWPLALNDPAHISPQVQRATHNLLTRMLKPRDA
ncbi:hypothetical protein ACWD6R_15655 [Streptomyces sp. NPDC005151]